jgi:hypothetical protein
VLPFFLPSQLYRTKAAVKRSHEKRSANSKNHYYGSEKEKKNRQLELKRVETTLVETAKKLQIE